MTTTEKYKNCAISVAARKQQGGTFYAKYTITRTENGAEEFVMQGDDFGSFATPEKAIAHSLAQAKHGIDDAKLVWKQRPDA